MTDGFSIRTLCDVDGCTVRDGLIHNHFDGSLECWMTERGAALMEYRFTPPDVDTAFWLAAVEGGLLLCTAVAVGWGFELGVRRFRGQR